MRMQVSIPKCLVFIFTITLLTLSVLGNLSYGDTTRPQIYWTDLEIGKIQRANLNGTNLQDVVVTTGPLVLPLSIALDVAGGKIYWTSFSVFGGKIQQANLDGSNVQDIVVTTGPLESPAGIALDVAGGKVYWTAPEIGKIQCANLDGSNVQDIITTGLESPAGIALDVAGGKVYWTAPEIGKIQCANLDGSNVQDIITTGLVAPNYIALDVAGGKMYWTDNSTGKIQQANLDGTNAQDIITGLTEPISIALSIPRFAADVNGDSVVNIQDLVLVAGAFGETSENAADVNGDSVVNIQDLVLVAGAFGAATTEPSFRPIEDLTMPGAEFFSAIPVSGSEIGATAKITLTFSSDPGDVTSSAGTVVAGSGKARTISGPFIPGALSLTLAWTNGDGIHTLSYNVTAPDFEPPKVIGGTVKDGDEDVDFDKINEGKTIEVTFSEEVSGNIALQTTGGDDVGWIGKVEGTKGTLELIKGKEIGAETTYVISSKISDAAGNETEVNIIFATTFRGEPVAIENLVAYWSFDRFDREGNWVFDFSGNGNDGRIIGQPSRFPGKSGEALEFDGENDAVVVPDDATFGEENITLMGWFNPDGVVTNRPLIVKNDSFYVGFDNNNLLTFVVQPNDTSVKSVSRLAADEYNHFAVTYDGKTMRVYINGELENEQPNDIPIARSEADLVIGEGFAGSIDEVWFYNKALTEDEISIMAEVWHFFVRKLLP